MKTGTNERHGSLGPLLARPCNGGLFACGSGVPLAESFSQSSIDLIPRKTRQNDNTKGVESLSPRLPESARATLGAKATQPTHFARSAASEASISVASPQSAPLPVKPTAVSLGQSNHFRHVANYCLAINSGGSQTRSNQVKPFKLVPSARSHSQEKVRFIPLNLANEAGDECPTPVQKHPASACLGLAASR
jgi:hypothetical protein